MPELVADCPRCNASRTTFDVLSSNRCGTRTSRWAHRFEAFCVCRHCSRAVVFVLELSNAAFGEHFAKSKVDSFNGSINSIFEVRGFVNLKDLASVEPPEHLPPKIEEAFREGATCLAVNCFNAAGTMFRLCVDHATSDLLPAEGAEGGPNAKQRRELGLRLQWLFENHKLPSELHDLAQCIKDDGNDGAHRGTLNSSDAGDLLDFTVHLLERRYTLPRRVEDAAARRAARPR